MKEANKFVSYEGFVDFFNRARRLSHIDRCNQLPKIKHYSVAEHSYYCALLGFVLADIVREYDGIEIDKNVLIQRLLLHDVEESCTGDILYPIHNLYLAFKAQLEKVRDHVVDEYVFKGLDDFISEKYKNSWRFAKDNSNEGELVRVIDKLEILLFATQELDMGNHIFREIFNNAILILKKECNFKSIMKIVEFIEKRYSYIL